MTQELFLGLTAIVFLLAGWALIRFDDEDDLQASLGVFVMGVGVIFIIGLMAMYALHLPSAWSSK